MQDASSSCRGQPLEAEQTAQTEVQEKKIVGWHSEFDLVFFSSNLTMYLYASISRAHLLCEGSWCYGPQIYVSHVIELGKNWLLNSVLSQ